ncbi:uncharacterized protein LOC130561434 isoform X2 [Triplophysa rosa]|uniref:uncharacterized protein LOC130561434 isoform X2 n=1 Tax=Triplophysa rosa TaxID=992332 RepID=UPI00254610AF|nr:uncharacterized protein LOC130561434 isoform X2 [Triplophysa rosa]
MSGKAWTFTLFTTVSFFTIYIHHAKSECMPNDLPSHLHEELLEDHLFEMKVFLDSKEQHKVLSVINTLCSTWNKNMNKEMKKFKIIETFKIMLEHLFNKTKEITGSQELLQECGKYNCTDADGYLTTSINITAFGSMYSEYCNTSLSGLECPSKKRTTSSTSNSPAPTASELTNHIGTASSNTTDSPISDASGCKQTIKSIREHLADTSIKVLLAASLLLNVLLLFWLWYRKNGNRQANTETEMRLKETRDSN